VCVLSESVTGNDSGKCVLDALEPIYIFCIVPYRRELAGADKRICNRLSHIVSYSRTNMADLQMELMCLSRERWESRVTPRILMWSDNANLHIMRLITASAEHPSDPTYAVNSQ